MCLTYLRAVARIATAGNSRRARWHGTTQDRTSTTGRGGILGCVCGRHGTHGGTGDVVDHGDRMETPGVVRAVARFQFEWRAARCFIRVVAVAQAELESAAVLAIVCWGSLNGYR